jgi:hypothetical protein
MWSDRYNGNLIDLYVFFLPWGSETEGVSF